MTKKEWIDRCTSRFVEKLGIHQEQAKKMVVACFDGQMPGEGFEFNEHPQYSPEDCADEEISYLDYDEVGRGN